MATNYGIGSGVNPIQQNSGMANWAENSYLYTGNPSNYKNFNDLIRQLGFSNLDNITNFNSPLYQQYAQYLQRTQGGVGVNSLLAPLMAGGTGYAGGMNIAGQRAQELNRERQDSINNNVQGFAMNMQNNVMQQLGQIGNNYMSEEQLKLKQEEMDAANSPWGAIGQLFGNALPMVANLFGAPTGGASAAGSVGGYGG